MSVTSWDQEDAEARRLPRPSDDTRLHDLECHLNPVLVSALIAHRNLYTVGEVRANWEELEREGITARAMDSIARHLLAPNL